MKNVIEIFRSYQGNTAILILAFMSAIYLIAKAREDKVEKMVVAGAVMLILMYNDLIFYLIEWIWGMDAYRSYVYAIPVTMMCAMTATFIIFRDADTLWKRCVVATGVIIIGLAAYRSDVSPDFSKVYAAEGKETYSQMSDDIMNDVAERRYKICNDAYTEAERIRIAADTEIYSYLRGLNSEFVMAYDITDTTWADSLLLSEPLIYSMVVGGGQTEHNLIREMLSINCVDYAVIETEYEMDEYMKLVGYSKMGEYDKYTLYGRDSECYPMRIDYWGYVRRVYFYLLGRRGTYEEIYSEIQKIGAHEQTLDEIAYKVLESDEFIERAMIVDETIEAIYHAIYYRDVTDVEKEYWEQYIANGGSYREMYYELYYNTGEFHIDWE